MSRYNEVLKERDNVTKTYNYLTARGIAPHLVAGIIGNLQQESYKHLDSTAENEIGAVGIAQWYKVRRTDLENFARDRGKDFKDFDLQLDFLYHELTTTGNSWGRKGRDAFFQAKNAEEAAAMFVKYFERSGEKPGDEGHTRRLNNAKSVYLLYNDNNIYGKDENNNTVVINPAVATKDDVAKSHSIKKQFYHDVFNVENDRPQAENKQIREAITGIFNRPDKKEPPKQVAATKAPIVDIFAQVSEQDEEVFAREQQQANLIDITGQPNEFFEFFLNE